ncbi:MBL fold metallo-hydrolase [uncultured Oxalicibacterium sp.]|uniref:MBL fold metallo-hydrolase n=1 Tax=uncultured Oxalicibacterium sp. TaxID=1168540 RepID=UPI0025D8481B|nr:MBL fold metallo-hydrolase [uncultured Oxalicibacterium sp.]
MTQASVTRHTARTKARFGKLPLSLALVVALAVSLTLTACSNHNPYYDPAKPHHTPEGFRNNYLDRKPDGLLKWQWQRITQGLPKPPENNYQFPVVRTDIAWLRANKNETSATWIGHSTMLLQVRGTNILTDPIWSERASPVSFMGPKRRVPVPFALTELPHIDVVLISHNHYDHLDRATVEQLNRQPGGAPLFLVPLGIKPWLAELGITNVQELDWWDATSAKGLDFHLVPAQHWSARSLTDRQQTLWGGWTIHTQPSDQAPFSIFFAGDTGFSKDFEEIAKRFGSFDLALIPIGAYAPRWFMHTQHVDPADAVKIHKTVKARHSIGIHWGTFELADESLDEPPRVLAEETKKAGLAKDAFVVLKHGETTRFDASGKALAFSETSK